MRILLIVAIFITGVAGLFYFKNENIKLEKRSLIKQACVEKYNNMPQASNIISDVDGFCGCNAGIERTGTATEIKAAGRACMDQYGKPGLIQRCEDMNKAMSREVADAKGIDCGCFYNQLITLFGDEMIGQNSDEEPLTKKQRDETVGRAFMACKK